MTTLRTHMSFTFAPARLCIVVLFCVATVIASPAQNTFFTTLASFDGPNGDSPYSSLIQATDGNFYGTTFWGGAYGSGVVFKITPGGNVTTLYSFCSQPNCTDGAGPFAALAQATDGSFYGTTQDGGAYGGGTVFKITSAGTLTTLYSFCPQANCADGAGPRAALVQGTDGNFYGTTTGGGSGSYGTVFKITASGTLTTLYSFCSQSGCTDGAEPEAGLVQATDGNFYGTTYFGGSNPDCNDYDYGCGTVFKITPNGALTTLYSFCSQSGCPDGSFPYAGLALASDGNFYGTTDGGGANYCGSGNYCGTVFRITPAGELTTLHSFDGVDGEYPDDALVQGTDGNLYGTTSEGGDINNCPYIGCGTAFKSTPAGTLTTLHNFCALGYPCPDGSSPRGGLVQARDGNFYGTTQAGGAFGEGTVFRLGVVRTCATCRP